MKRKDFRAPTLVGPTWLYQGSGPSSCTMYQEMFKNDVTKIWSLQLLPEAHTLPVKNI